MFVVIMRCFDTKNKTEKIVSETFDTPKDAAEYIHEFHGLMERVHYWTLITTVHINDDDWSSPSARICNLDLEVDHIKQGREERAQMAYLNQYSVWAP